MGFVALLHRLFVLIPQKLRDSKMGHTIILLVIMGLHIEHVNAQYKITAQRIELRLAIVTPVELDAMEGLCILNLNPIKDLLYDKEQICTPGVKEFFYERLDNKDPQRY